MLENELNRMNRLAGLSEVSLSRVYSHFRNDSIPVVIVTAFRDDKSNAKNISDNKAIASEAKSQGYGYVFLDGAWQDPNTNEELREDSIFIIGNKNDNGKLKGLVKKWIKKYNQDAALWKEENQSNISLMFQNGNTKKLGKFSAKTAEHGYTKLRGHSGRVFTFERAYTGKNWLGRWASKIENNSLND